MRRHGHVLMREDVHDLRLLIEFKAIVRKEAYKDMEEKVVDECINAGLNMEDEICR